MFKRAEETSNGPAHARNAAAARRLANKPLAAGKPLEMRQQELAQAATLATLALYELLASRDA